MVPADRGSAEAAVAGNRWRTVAASHPGAIGVDWWRTVAGDRRGTAAMDRREPTAVMREDPPRVRSRTLQRLLSPARLGQFLAVGVLGALCDNAALVALHGVMDLPLAPAKVASAELGILLMFAANENWTFAGEGAAELRAVARRLVTSNAVRLVGLATGLAVLLGLVHLGVWYLAANVVGLGVGFVANYCFESLVTWRVHLG